VELSDRSAKLVAIVIVTRVVDGFSETRLRMYEDVSRDDKRHKRSGRSGGDSNTDKPAPEARPEPDPAPVEEPEPDDPPTPADAVEEKIRRLEAMGRWPSS